MAKAKKQTAGEMLSNVAAGLMAGKMPEGNSFEACLVRSAIALLDEYVQRDTALTAELDAMIEAFGNKSDPFISTLGFMEHAGVRAMLNNLRVTRKARRAREEEERGQQSG